MAAIIQTPLGEARIEDYQWHSLNKLLQAYLNAMLNPLGPSGGDPNPDDTAAREAVNEFPGSRLVSSDETEEDLNVIH